METQFFFSSIYSNLKTNLVKTNKQTKKQLSESHTNHEEIVFIKNRKFLLNRNEKFRNITSLVDSMNCFRFIYTYIIMGEDCFPEENRAGFRYIQVYIFE